MVICLVRGDIFGMVANLRQALLSSCTVDCGTSLKHVDLVLDNTDFIFRLVNTCSKISFNTSLVPINSLIQRDMLIYSASIVDSATCVYNLELHKMGKFMNIIRYPDLNFTHIES